MEKARFPVKSRPGLVAAERISYAAFPERTADSSDHMRRGLRTRISKHIRFLPLFPAHADNATGRTFNLCRPEKAGYSSSPAEQPENGSIFMSVDAVRAFLKEQGLESAYREFSSSSAAVALAAAVLGCEEGRIAKTLSLMTKSGPIVVVTMGTARLDNRKYKEHFGEKAVFIKPDELEQAIGHPMGGCCPFALKPEVRVYLDTSLRAFDPVYPAAGAPNNAVELTLEQLEQLTRGEWIDVCKSAENGL